MFWIHELCVVFSQIDGQSAYSVDGGGKIRCFSISGSSTSVTINGLAIKNGYVRYHYATRALEVR